LTSNRKELAFSNRSNPCCEVLIRIPKPLDLLRQRELSSIVEKSSTNMARAMLSASASPDVPPANRFLGGFHLNSGSELEREVAGEEWSMVRGVGGEA
jgi:hypothetical protein